MANTSALDLSAIRKVSFAARRQSMVFPGKRNGIDRFTKAKDTLTISSLLFLSRNNTFSELAR